MKSLLLSIAEEKHISGNGENIENIFIPKYRKMILHGNVLNDMR